MKTGAKIQIEEGGDFLDEALPFHHFLLALMDCDRRSQGAVRNYFSGGDCELSSIVDGVLMSGYVSDELPDDLADYLNDESLELLENGQVLGSSDADAWVLNEGIVYRVQPEGCWRLEGAESTLQGLIRAAL